MLSCLYGFLFREILQFWWFMIRSTACGKGGLTSQRNAVETSCIYIITLFIAYWFQKRKKNSYLTSGVPPPTRQLTRSLRAEPHREEKPSLPSVQESTAGPQQRTALPQTTAAGSLSLRIPGLPASLTIERVQRAVCVMCRKPGEWFWFSWPLWTMLGRQFLEPLSISQLLHHVCWCPCT